MKIVNLTPHTVNVGDQTFPASGQLARCEETWEQVDIVKGITFLMNFKYGETNLPEEQSDTYLIVSLQVALAEPNRNDLLIAVGQIRNEAGQIIGAKGLARL